MSKLREEIRFHGKTFPNHKHILINQKGQFVMGASEASLFKEVAEKHGLMDVEIKWVVSSPDKTVKYYMQ